MDTVQLMTGREVAKLLRIPRTAVYSLPIPRVRISKRRIRFRRVDVLRLIGMDEADMDRQS